MTSPRDLARIRSLVELAADPRTPANEAAAAGIQACRRLKASGMLEGSVIPIVSAKDAGLALAVVECALIVMQETQKSYRVAYATEQSRTRGSAAAGWVPKRLVVGIEWMDATEARRRFGVMRPVMQRIHVAARNVEMLKRCVRTTDVYADEGGIR